VRALSLAPPASRCQGLARAARPLGGRRAAARRLRGGRSARAARGSRRGPARQGGRRLRDERDDRAAGCARVWTDRSGSVTVALHPKSHIDFDEDGGYERLHGLTPARVGGVSPFVVEDLQALSRPLGLVVVELPLRRAGYKLPSWGRARRDLGVVSRPQTAAALRRGAPLGVGALLPAVVRRAGSARRLGLRLLLQGTWWTRRLRPQRPRRLRRRGPRLADAPGREPLHGVSLRAGCGGGAERASAEDGVVLRTRASTRGYAR